MIKSWFRTLLLVQVWNLRIGAMLRTIFPALAHAIDMNSCPTLHQEGTAKNIKDKLHVHSAIICFYL